MPDGVHGGCVWGDWAQPPPCAFARPRLGVGWGCNARIRHWQAGPSRLNQGRSTSPAPRPSCGPGPAAPPSCAPPCSATALIEHPTCCPDPWRAPRALKEKEHRRPPQSWPMLLQPAIPEGGGGRGEWRRALCRHGSRHCQVQDHPHAPILSPPGVLASLEGTQSTPLGSTHKETGPFAAPLSGTATALRPLTLADHAMTV